MRLLFNYIDGIDAFAGVFAKLLKRYFKKIRLGPFEFQLRQETAESYETTFKKIEAAQRNLAEAVEALDSLKVEYLDENKRLGKLLDDVKKKREEYHDATRELDVIKNLTSEEREQLRRSLGFNDRRSKIVGFIAGVLASLIATGLWVGIPKLWVLIVDLWTKLGSGAGNG